MYCASNPGLDLHIKDIQDEKGSRCWMSLQPCLSLLSCLFKAEKAQLQVWVTEFVVEYEVLMHNISFSFLRESGFSWREGTRVSVRKFSFFSPSHKAAGTQLCSTIALPSPLQLRSHLRAWGEVTCLVYSSSTLYSKLATMYEKMCFCSSTYPLIIYFMQVRK